MLFMGYIAKINSEMISLRKKGKDIYGISPTEGRKDEQEYRKYIYRWNQKDAKESSIGL